MKINSILKCAGAGVPAGLCLCLLSAAVKVEAANGVGRGQLVRGQYAADRG